MGLREQIILRESNKKDFYGRPVSGPEENLLAVQKIRLTDHILKPFRDVIKGIIFKKMRFHEDNDIDAFISMDYIYIHPRVKEPLEIKQIIIHEMCHVLYDLLPELFNDGEVMNEFLEKRTQLYNNLYRLGFRKYAVQSFMYPKYTSAFDTMMHLEVPEEMARRAIKGVFPTIYSTVSFEEYWAVLFEEYFENPEEIKRNYPLVHKKILEILKASNEVSDE